MATHETFIIRCRAVILNEGKLLVVKHSKDASYYALPGGHMDHGEDIQECMRREVVEELGIEPKVGRLLYINNFVDKGDVSPSIEFFFEITNGNDYVDFEKLARSHSYELFDIQWVRPTDAVSILPLQFAEDFKGEKILSDEIRFINSKR